MLSLNVPDYDSAATELIQEVLNGFMNIDPLFAGIERSFTTHQGPFRNVRGETPLDQNMFAVRGEALISWDSVSNSKVDDYIKFLVDISESQRKGLARQFFRSITEITDATGNTVDAKGKPLTFDMILDLLEKIEFGFDDDGNPLYPTLILPPKMIEQLKKIKPTAEQETRKKIILEGERIIFNAKKRSRRLS